MLWYFYGFTIYFGGRRIVNSFYAGVLAEIQDGFNPLNIIEHKGRAIRSTLDSHHGRIMKYVIKRKAGHDGTHFLVIIGICADKNIMGMDNNIFRMPT